MVFEKAVVKKTIQANQCHSIMNLSTAHSGFDDSRPTINNRF